jgi:hypothetical protein
MLKKDAAWRRAHYARKFCVHPMDSGVYSVATGPLGEQRARGVERYRGGTTSLFFRSGPAALLSQHPWPRSKNDGSCPASCPSSAPGNSNSLAGLHKSPGANPHESSRFKLYGRTRSGRRGRGPARPAPRHRALAKNDLESRPRGSMHPQGQGERAGLRPGPLGSGLAGRCCRARAKEAMKGTLQFAWVGRSFPSFTFFWRRSICTGQARCECTEPGPFQTLVARSCSGAGRLPAPRYWALPKSISLSAC